jgi:ketol-acid reductoisomerase
MLSWFLPKGQGFPYGEISSTGAASIAALRSYIGKAEEKTLALGIAMGSGYLFQTTFEKEVFNDLVGERGVLIGAIAGIMEAQYAVLRKHNHSPSEAFNETVEEFTQSLIKLTAEKGMDWLYVNCSTTAQRGALDWKERFSQTVAPVFDTLYESIANGNEAKIVLEKNSQPDYW